MKVYYFLILTQLILGIFICNAQNIIVESFKLIENDLDARVNFPKKDQNGEVCAIIKFVTTATNFEQMVLYLRYGS